MNRSVLDGNCTSSVAGVALIGACAYRLYDAGGGFEDMKARRGRLGKDVQARIFLVLAGWQYKIDTYRGSFNAVTVL